MFIARNWYHYKDFIVYKEKDYDGGCLSDYCHILLL